MYSIFISLKQSILFSIQLNLNGKKKPNQKINRTINFLPDTAVMKVQKKLENSMLKGSVN